jgi:electron transfer flavoprotein alpha subunit
MSHDSIWVYASQSDGVVQPVTFELLGKARGLAVASGMSIEAVVIGHEVEPLV